MISIYLLGPPSSTIDYWQLLLPHRNPPGVSLDGGLVPVGPSLFKPPIKNGQVHRQIRGVEEVGGFRLPGNLDGLQAAVSHPVRGVIDQPQRNTGAQLWSRPDFILTGSNLLAIGYEAQDVIRPEGVPFVDLFQELIGRRPLEELTYQVERAFLDLEITLSKSNQATLVQYRER